MEEEPGERLGEEVGALRRHSLASAREVEDLVDAQTAEEERHVRRATVDRSDSVVAMRRVGDAVEAVPVDELDVEFALATTHELDTLAAIRDYRRAFVGLFVETEQRLVEVVGQSIRAAYPVAELDAGARGRLDAALLEAA